MSTSPFRDSITIFHNVGAVTLNRFVPVVRTLVTDAIPRENGSAVVFIPIYNKRSIEYLPPDKFVLHPDGAFTVQTGDRFVCRNHSGSEPDDCFTVSSVTVNDHGSRRLRYIKIIGKLPPLPEDEDEDGNPEDDDE